MHSKGVKVNYLLETVLDWLAAQKCLQLLWVELVGQLSPLDSLEGICTRLDYLLWLLLATSSLFDGCFCLLLLDPGRVVLNPDVLLKFALLVIQDELFDFLGVNPKNIFLFLLLLTFFASFLFNRLFTGIFLEDVFSVAPCLRNTVFFKPLSGLLKLPLEPPHLPGKFFLRNVQVILKLLPWDLLSLFFVR